MNTMHSLLHMNYWAILVSAVIQWVLGAVWYSPAMFAKPWMALLKITPKMATEGGKKEMPKGLVVGMISSFLGGVILSLVLLHVVLWAGAADAGSGVFVGFLCWLGFIACPSFAQGIYEQRPFPLFAINSGYWLVCLLTSGALLAVWR